ncbi:MAG TPA: gephyrin-like molybdotransferase Glp [Solirubrobacteraceae bacterium]|nr:gephyrin-like molybdotransferase Glp [Solirubrobacteraceae bacterium]
MTVGLIEMEQARRAVLENIVALEGEPVELDQALGRTLAADVRSLHPVPAFTGSAMDGYAIRAEDVRGALHETPVTLKLVGESRAGHPTTTAVGPGETIAISTGAMLPPGADAVVRVEDTAAADGRVAVRVEAQAGQDVRYAGEDIPPGRTVLAHGARVGPTELGVLASLGCPTPTCTRRPRVSVLTTGDELLPAGEKLTPGAVRNSNAYTIPALAQRLGAQVTQRLHAPDNPHATETAIARALEADVAVICGGVSVGAHDHVKGALATLGVDERFSGVALRPGKPTWFGTRHRTLVFGLPGNPVSAMVTFILFVAPALRALSGAAATSERGTATLVCDYEKRPGRAHAVRCALTLCEDGWQATPTGPQGSHILTSMLGADALAIIPSASGSLHAGDRVQVELLTPWVGCGL